MPVKHGEWNRNTPKPMLWESNLWWYAGFCEDIDKRIGETNEFTPIALMQWMLALVGEAGEAANIVKKIIRDGPSPALWKALGIELVDILIYKIKLVAMLEEAGLLNFDELWEEKHKELLERIASGKLGAFNRVPTWDIKGVAE